jgi:hypothetical protein
MDTLAFKEIPLGGRVYARNRFSVPSAFFHIRTGDRKITQGQKAWRQRNDFVTS